MNNTVLMENQVTNKKQAKANPEIFHRPAMVQEVIQFLVPKNGIFVDATVGGGGHAEAILLVLENGFLVGIDLDQEAIAFSQLRLKRFSNFRLFNNNYTELDRILEEIAQNPEYQQFKLMGVLFDLGISLHQVRTPKRGFSYELNGPLDMRFGQGIDCKAIEIIRHFTLPEMEKILQEFGEERFYKRIARTIFENRQKLNSTNDLTDLIRNQLINKPRPMIKKALQRIFQALRITTNNELKNLETGLQLALKLLAPEGRIVVLSYHSLEDRIVKLTFRELAKHGKLEILTKKPLKPLNDEIRQNPAAASACLRAAMKIG